MKANNDNKFDTVDSGKPEIKKLSEVKIPKALISLVEMSGLEPPTCTLRTYRSPN